MPLLATGLKAILDVQYRRQNIPTSFKLIFCWREPSISEVTVASLPEIATGNNYTAGTGVAVARDTTTGFDAAVADATNDRGYQQMKDKTLTAVGGPIPASGNPMTHVALCDNNNNVILHWDLGGARVLAEDEALTLVDAEIELANNASNTSGWTNTGAAWLLSYYFSGTAGYSTVRWGFFTSATAPTPDTVAVTALTEVSATFGYTSYTSNSLSLNTTNFDTIEAWLLWAHVQAADITVTATGGSISGMRYFCFIHEDNTNLLAYWDLGEDKTITDGNKIIMRDLTHDLRWLDRRSSN